jgi:hypothetical protein
VRQPNINHIKGIRDAAYAALDEFARSKGLSEIHSQDAVIGLTYALATIIKDAPDSETRGRLQMSVMQAITNQAVEGTPSSVIVPKRPALLVN